MDPAQRRVVSALTGTGALWVIEGAAGAGKTATLAQTRRRLDAQGRRLVVVTPTLKAAQTAQEQVGSAAFSAARFVHAYGHRWDEDGHWTQHPCNPALKVWLDSDDVLVVDEAGMLDQDTARALLQVVDRTDACVAFLGDRHQLPAVGRGGVLDLAARWVHPEAHLELDVLHRFTDPTYAHLTQLMRTGEYPGEVFDTLLARGEVILHATEAERLDALTNPDSGQHAGEPEHQTPTREATGERLGERSGETAAESRGQTGGTGGHARGEDLGEDIGEPTGEPVDEAGQGPGNGHPAAPAGAVAPSPSLVMADTREQVAALNAALRDQRLASGAVKDQTLMATNHGEPIAVGDQITTRRNDRDLGVANRDLWTVTGSTCDDSGHLHIRVRSHDPATGQHRGHSDRPSDRTGGGDERVLPAAYVRRHVELAYATTVYGAQGQTVDDAHLLLGESTGAAAAYVAMTRGREHNTVHIVAEDPADARRQWVEAFARDRADLGPGHAAHTAAEDIDRYGPQAPPRSTTHGNTDRSAVLQAAMIPPAQHPPGARRLEDERSPIAPRPERGRGIGR